MSKPVGIPCVSDPEAAAPLLVVPKRGEGMEQPFQVYDYHIDSSHDVDAVVEEIAQIAEKRLLVQIASYMHNTVMVQSLVHKLAKRFPQGGVVFLGADRGAGTTVTVYTGSDAWVKESDPLSISSEVVRYFREEYDTIAVHLQICKEQVLRRHFIDPLTNLPNLYQLRDDLDTEEEHTFIVINIDNFKLINDFYGLVVGDYILEQTAWKIAELMEGMPVYRMYGDEFGVVLDRRMEFYELKQFLEKINAEMQNLHFRYDQNLIYVDITLASSASSSRYNTFSKVGMALKYAKEMRLPYWIYEDHMHFEHEYENNLKIAVKVRKAIENSGIVPYFQPIICNETGEVGKFECLSRLVDDKGNILPPKMFIAIAKTIKAYSQVTRSIIDKSFEIFSRNDYDFSINLAIEDVLNREIFDFIIEKLQSSGFGSRVTFELVESKSVEDYKEVGKFISEIKRYGAQVAIDNFGSGFSNFAYLTQIDVDYIKIDGSLINDIDQNKNSELIVRTIVGFAERMGIKTVAEHVHSSTILSFVKQLGIDYSQGYYIDQPMPKLPEKPAV
jgi:diguanylate cyclase (GGDEF)-like protein